MVKPIADAVGTQLEVVMDGGIRRGSDVVKAVALGARAVMIGRAYLWGLAANGQAGVENVLDVLRSGIDSTLLGLGLSSIDELDADQLLVPDGFHRALGATDRRPAHDMTDAGPSHQLRGGQGIGRRGPHRVAGAARAAPAARHRHRDRAGRRSRSGASGSGDGALRRSPTDPAVSTRTSPGPRRSVRRSSAASSSSWSAHCATGPVAWSWSTGTAATSRRCRPRSSMLVSEGHDVCWVPCAAPGMDAHAGRAETSLMLHLRPESVRLELAPSPGTPHPSLGLLPHLRAGGVAAVSRNGVLGDPRGATAEEGERLLALMIGTARSA